MAGGWCVLRYQPSTHWKFEESRVINCPSCATDNPDQSRFCGECGAALKPIPDHVPRLEVTRGGRVGKVYLVDQEVINIGRWDPDGGAFPEVDLTNDDAEAKVSRRHARVLLNEGSAFVEDMGSLNGTYVNRGSRLIPGEPHPLHDGDEIIIGKTFFKFFYPGDAPAAEAQ